jgi:hypothetical protein
MIERASEGGVVPGQTTPELAKVLRPGERWIAGHAFVADGGDPTRCAVGVRCPFPQEQHAKDGGEVNQRQLFAFYVIVAAALLAGCAPAALTREQEHAYRAVEACAGQGLQRDWNYWVLPDGAIRFSGRGDGFSPVQECLTRRYGYRF